MSTDDDQRPAGHSNHDERRAQGAQSPRELLALHDTSRKRGTGQAAAGRGHGVSVQWVRPTELAARVAARTAAGAVAAHVAAHRQVREHLRTRLAGDGTGRRARLAPLSAFGRPPGGEPAAPMRSVVGR